jgi:hypothetical protein
VPGTGIAHLPEREAATDHMPVVVPVSLDDLVWLCSSYFSIPIALLNDMYNLVGVHLEGGSKGSCRLVSAAARNTKPLLDGAHLGIYSERLLLEALFTFAFC